MNRHELTKQGRAIGAAGALARIILGLVFLFPAFRGLFRWDEVLLGLVGFPAILLLTQWLRLRYTSEPLRSTGPFGFCANVMVFLALYLTPLYFPPLSLTSDAVLIFYGASMLLAALRGYAGCEVLAISNWLLRRDDQIGCIVFSPLDALEAQLTGTRQSK